MMKDISIFIAGATKETKDERECLKILANDLSYAKRADGISIKAMSYENFNDNQERYNEFIENEADIVFVILKGGIGEKTKEEFVKAAESWREKKRPEVIVFLEENSFEENSYNAGEIRTLMEVLLKQQYPVRYTTLEELRSAAKIRIEWYIGKITKQKDSESNNQSILVSTESSSELSLNKENPNQNKVTSGFQKFFHFWQAWLLVALAVLLGGLLIWSGVSRKSEPVAEIISKPVLVFAGGGSVYQYLKNVKRIDIDTVDNSIYIRMPSSQSWMLLAEEVNRKNNKFYPISLSACEAPDSSFIKACTNQEFKKRAAIISYYLGEDTLVLYMTDTIYRNYKNFGLDKTEVSKNDFGKLIHALRSDGVQILHTTPTSGTLECWQTCMEPNDAAKIENDNSIFNEISSNDLLRTDSRYVILGSRNYFMQDLKAKKDYGKFIIEKTICDENGILLSKPIYLYFVAYKDKNGVSTTATDDSREKVWLPDEVLRFLKQLNIEGEVKNDTLKWNLEKGYIYNDDPHIILHLN